MKKSYIKTIDDCIHWCDKDVPEFHIFDEFLKKGYKMQTSKNPFDDYRY